MEPRLIHTSKGNVDVDLMEYSTSWHEDDNAVSFVETYTLKGEIVRQSKHVMVKKGLSLFNEQERV